MARKVAASSMRGGPAEGSPAAGARAHERTLMHRSGLTVRVSNGDGSTTTLLSYPRNVSAGGVSFLSGTALRPGTRCSVQFAAAGGRRVVVSGEVRWNAPVIGRVHRVGVEFDRPLDERQLRAVSG